MTTKTITKPTKTQIKAQIKAAKELMGRTHELLNEKGVKMYADPFVGFTPRLKTYHANPRDPKGLTLNDGSKSAVGLATWDLAWQIYNHLDLTGAQDCFGRGSQQRAYLDVVVKHLEAQLER